MRCLIFMICLLIAAVSPGSTAVQTRKEQTLMRFDVSFSSGQSQGPLDGRLLLLISDDDRAEPRFQISEGPNTQIVFGIDVEGWKPGSSAIIDAKAAGYPLATLNDVPPGNYFVQALLHRYETFRRADGHTVKLPMDRGEGQQWNRAPGNLYSTPQKVRVDPKKDGSIKIRLDSVIPPIPDPPETPYVKHVRIQSEKLSKFWGRPMFLGAHILLPEGFDSHPNARYPLVINHGHFPYTFDGFRPEPPDPNLEPDFSERFNWKGYNLTQQDYAHQFYKYWIAPDTPRMLIVEIQHANPYYDDSYAVNSANLGPYGDAITYELIPYIEQKFRGIGKGWARFMYGGSTGGWEALAAQVFYPDEFNGCWASCPDPIDFRAYTVVDLYKDKNAYFIESRWKKTPRPGMRNYLGHVSTLLQDTNQLEAVLGSKGRSGGQWDIWQAVFSPVGKDGYPEPIWDKITGVINPEVAAYWKKNYDLSHILQRDWPKLGPRLRGKIHIYVGDMDNYYLNNAVYLIEEFLRNTTDPPYEGEIVYGDRFEHCWNGDPTRPNAITRLCYHQLHAPKILQRIEKSAPPGSDLSSWRY